MALIWSRVAAATFCESGASLNTMETVETENPQAWAMSSNVTWPDFRWAIILLPRRRVACLLGARHSRGYWSEAIPEAIAPSLRIAIAGKERLKGKPADFSLDT
jgi:hypothetical protein